MGSSAEVVAVERCQRVKLEGRDSSGERGFFLFLSYNFFFKGGGRVVVGGACESECPRRGEVNG